MTRVLAALAGLLMLTLAGMASAAEEASGKVAAMDANVLILDDGSSYTLGEGVSVEGLQPGTEVTVSFEIQGGERIATEVKPAN